MPIGGRKYATVEANSFFKAAYDFNYLGATINETFSEPYTDVVAKEILRIAKDLVPVLTSALKSTGRVVMSKRAISKYRRAKEVRFGNSFVKYARVVEFGRVDYAPCPPKADLRPAVQAVAMKNKQSKIGSKGVNRSIRKAIKKRYLP